MNEYRIVTLLDAVAVEMLTCNGWVKMASFSGQRSAERYIENQQRLDLQDKI